MTVLTTLQVAELLQVDRHTVGRLVRSKKLKAKKIGNSYRFKQEWVDEFLENEESAATVPLTGKKRLELTQLKAEAA